MEYKPPFCQIYFFSSLLLSSSFWNPWHCPWACFSGEWLHRSFCDHILNIIYKHVKINYFAFGQKYLMLDQDCNSLFILAKNTNPFDGLLGIYHHEKFHIDLKPDTQPLHYHDFPVPQDHNQSFKNILIAWSKTTSLNQIESLQVGISSIQHPQK